MPANQVRLSTLAEIRVLSYETFRNFSGEANISVSKYVEKLSGDNINAKEIGELSKYFKTVGIARQVRIDEDYGTQPIYGIGAPTRPRMVPNNFSVNVTCDRIQLDKRHLYDFMSSPEYFYSGAVQAKTGILDEFYYTYLFIRDKEPSSSGEYKGIGSYDIYALMPRTSGKVISNGDVMISNSVQLSGFKVNYGNGELQNYLGSIQNDLTLTVPPPPTNTVTITDENGITNPGNL